MSMSKYPTYHLYTLDYKQQMKANKPVSKIALVFRGWNFYNLMFINISQSLRY